MILLKKLKVRLFFLTVLSSLFFSSVAQDASEGEQIFQTCIACHNLPGGGKLVGPDLKDVLTHDRFVNEEDPEGTLIKYVQNPSDFGVKLMPPQPLDSDEILSVLEFINTYVPEEIEEITTEEVATEQGMSSNSMLIIVIVILFVLIFALTSIKNTLKKTQDQPTETVSESIIKFCKAYWANYKAVMITSFIVFIIILKFAFDTMMGVGVVEKYQPDQPIEFSHKIHAGDNGIDCNYCHSSARSSKTAGVPSVNVCMNCHTNIKGNTDDAKAEIGKIWKSFGLDINDEEQVFDWDKIDTYEQNPIEWIRVHNLPDLTYFNHSQHVTVGGLECQQCHGDMEEKTVGQIATMEELNSQEFNVKGEIKFKHPTLTMGWCIDCHRQKEIDMGSNEYYAEMHERIKSDTIFGYKNKKITPDLIGGMECGKCHY
jgi:cytochrome c551/c552